MGGVPSIPTDRSRTLEVIGAGYSRTGTVALQLALEKLLDGPVLHGGTQILSREDAFCEKWVLAYKAKRSGDTPRLRALLRDLMAGFAGCSDLPPIDFLPDLLEMYPDAKVVLSTRDPDRWLQSIRPVARNASLWWLGCAMFIVPGWRWFSSLSLEFGTSAREVLADGDEADNPEPSTKLLHNWNDRVKQLVPPERLLIMELGQGWEPLCQFLGKPVPDEPFPRANDSNAAAKTYEDIVGKLRLIWLMGIASVFTLAASVLWLYSGH